MRIRHLFELRQEPALPDDEIVTAFRDGQVTHRKNRREDGFTTALQEIGYQRVHVGDLVIHSMDAFAGAIGVSDSLGKCSPVCQVLTPREDVDTRFVAYALRHASRTGYIQSLARGIRERSTDFRWSTARDVLIPKPPRATQEAVADFLDWEWERSSDLIARWDRFEERHDELLQSVLFEQLLEREPRVALGRVCTLQRGMDLPDAVRRPGAVPVIGSGGPMAMHDTGSLRGPGVITGRYGSVGAVHYVPSGPYWPLNTTLYVRDFKGNNPKWVYYLLRALPLKSESAKSAVPGLHRADAHRLQITHIDATRQDEVVRRVEEADQRFAEIKALAGRARAALVEYRDALTTEAVVGELTVSGNSQRAARTLRFQEAAS